MASSSQFWSVHDDYLEIRVRLNDLESRVLGVRVVVHTTGRMGNSDASDNHVTQYLLLPGSRSVQINMNHTPDDINGTLNIHSRDYRSSRSEIEHFPEGSETDITQQSPEIHQRFSVRDACTAITRLKLGDFTFAGGGMGCRAWQVVLLSLYEQLQWINPGETLKLHRYLSFQRSTRQAPTHIVMRQGTFDVSETQDFADNRWQTLVDSLQATLEAARSLPRERLTSSVIAVLRARIEQLEDLKTSAQDGASLVEARAQENS